MQVTGIKLILSRYHLSGYEAYPGGSVRIKSYPVKRDLERATAYLSLGPIVQTNMTASLFNIDLVLSFCHLLK